MAPCPQVLPPRSLPSRAAGQAAHLQAHERLRRQLGHMRDGAGVDDLRLRHVFGAQLAGGVPQHPAQQKVQQRGVVLLGQPLVVEHGGRAQHSQAPRPAAALLPPGRACGAARAAGRAAMLARHGDGGGMGQARRRLPDGSTSWAAGWLKCKGPGSRPGAAAAPIVMLQGCATWHEDRKGRAGACATTVEPLG